MLDILKTDIKNTRFILLLMGLFSILLLAGGLMALAVSGIVIPDALLSIFVIIIQAIIALDTVGWGFYFKDRNAASETAANAKIIGDAMATAETSKENQ